MGEQLKRFLSKVEEAALTMAPSKPNDSLKLELSRCGGHFDNEKLKGSQCPIRASGLILDQDYGQKKEDGEYW